MWLWLVLGAAGLAGGVWAYAALADLRRLAIAPTRLASARRHIEAEAWREAAVDLRSVLPLTPGRSSAQLTREVLTLAQEIDRALIRPGLTNAHRLLDELERVHTEGGAVTAASLRPLETLLDQTAAGRNAGHFRSRAPPLVRAVLDRDRDMLVQLLAAGADPDEVDALGMTGAGHALEAGHLGLLRPLLESGAQLAPTDHLTLFGELTLVQELDDDALWLATWLFQKPAFDPDWVNHATRQSATQWAESVGATALVTELQARSRAARAPGIEELLKAIYARDAAEVKHLMRRVDPAALTRRGQGADSPLEEAILEGSTPIIELILGAGAPLNHEDPDGGTPLTFALTQGAAPEIIQLLLDAGADPNLGSADGASPLTRAVDVGAPVEVVRALVDAGAAVDEDNNGSITPLIQACLNKNLALVELLLELGADPNQGADGLFPVEAAGGNPALLELLERARR